MNLSAANPSAVRRYNAKNYVALIRGLRTEQLPTLFTHSKFAHSLINFKQK